jgi:hypothetical protein
MVNHVNNADVVHHVVLKPEAPTIFTMKSDSHNANQKDITNIQVPLSYSSADSATEYASLFGEAIISKDTLFTTTNNTHYTGTNSSSMNTVIMMVDRCNGHKSNVKKHDTIVEDADVVAPQMDTVEDPICFSLCSNSSNHRSNANNDVKDDIVDHSPSTGVFEKRSSMLLPPLRDGSASPRREPLRTVSSAEEHSSSENRSNEFLDVIGCPCFQPSHLDYHSSSTSTSKHLLLPQPDGVPNMHTGSSNNNVDVLVLPKIRHLSLFDENEKKEDGNVDEDEDEEEHFQLDEELMTGIIEETGAHYHITKIIVEGWIHKKGTGHDWLGSRGWKARWARLAIGYIDGYDNVEVPLLGISWYPTSTNNSTVIVLDSTVVLAVDLPNKDRPHRLEIRHAKSSIATQSKKDNKNHKNAASTTDELPITRTFAAPSRKARDAWVYAISQALLSYEKDKAALRKLQLRNNSSIDGGGNNTSPSKQRLLAQQQNQHASTLPNVSPKTTRGYDDIWLNDRFPPPPLPSTTTGSGNQHRSPSPPLRNQSSIDQPSNHSNPQPSQPQHSSRAGAIRSKTPMTPTSIIGQDGFSTCTTPQEVMRHYQHYHPSHSTVKPMAIHARSTSA